jgi:hypothetical protein
MLCNGDSTSGRILVATADHVRNSTMVGGPVGKEEIGKLNLAASGQWAS